MALTPPGTPPGITPGTPIDRREVERLLARMDSILAPFGDGMHAVDAELRYIYWSARMERMTGRARGEVLGRSAADGLPFLVENGAERMLREALAGRTCHADGLRYEVPETGRTGYYSAEYAPLVIDRQRVGAVVLVRDTTERRRMEQLMRETEGRFRNMADASPVLLWMSGTDALCTFFNHTWLAFTGRTLEEEWGVGWAEGVHFEDLQRCLDTYQEAFAARRAFEMEYRLRRHDGVYRWILDRGAPRYAPDGTFAGYIGSCVDITERKDLEVGLREAVHARDEFLAIAAHELRTPLTPIQLTLQAMVRQAHGGRATVPVLLTRIESVERHVSRLTQLVENLLDVSHIASGPVRLSPENMELGATLSSVIGELEAVARTARSEIKLSVEREVRGRWDPGRLEQIVRNLVSNAIKYGGGASIEITVTLDAGAERARISVKDHGIGISAEDRERVFERFERAVSVRQFGGFGLGLWITRKLVEAMHGTIAVESEPGRGSTFVVELPLRPPDARLGQPPSDPFGEPPDEPYSKPDAESGAATPAGASARPDG